MDPLQLEDPGGSWRIPKDCEGSQKILTPHNKFLWEVNWGCQLSFRNLLCGSRIPKNNHCTQQSTYMYVVSPPTDPLHFRGSCWIPEDPGGSQRIRRIPENPGGSQRIPKNPGGSGGSQRILEDPEGSRRIPKDPEGSRRIRRIPENPGGSRRIPKDPGGSRRIPKDPKGSGGSQRILEDPGGSRRIRIHYFVTLVRLILDKKQLDP